MSTTRSSTSLVAIPNKFCRLLSILVVVILGAACSRASSAQATTFLLRSKEVDLPQASSRVLHALASELQVGGVLESPYPELGYVKTTPDPSGTGVELLHCTPGEPADPNQEACLLLNQAGDFARILPVTWQSQAFYMYRIYVLPRSLFARVDRSKDFVAIDIFLLQEPALWEAVAQAIRNTADELGARPFH